MTTRGLSGRSFMCLLLALSMAIVGSFSVFANNDVTAINCTDTSSADYDPSHMSCAYFSACTDPAAPNYTPSHPSCGDIVMCTDPTHQSYNATDPVCAGIIGDELSGF